VSRVRSNCRSAMVTPNLKCYSSAETRAVQLPVHRAARAASAGSADAALLRCISFSASECYLSLAPFVTASITFSRLKLPGF
jgi:hypothetical protein